MLLSRALARGRRRGGLPVARSWPRAPGTYALVLALQHPVEIGVGRLGTIRFESPFYIYVGSALGPGGLAARLRHHLRRAERPHWHIDYLRTRAEIFEIWLTEQDRRLECSWYNKLAGLHATRPVIGFGSSDCRCRSHLLALANVPSEAFIRECCSVPGSSQSLTRVRAAPTLAVQTLSHDGAIDRE